MKDREAINRAFSFDSPEISESSLIEEFGDPFSSVSPADFDELVLTAGWFEIARSPNMPERSDGKQPVLLFTETERSNFGMMWDGVGFKRDTGRSRCRGLPALGPLALVQSLRSLGVPRHPREGKLTPGRGWDTHGNSTSAK